MKRMTMKNAVACGLVLWVAATSACNICLEDRPCVTADPGDTIETIQCLDNSTTFSSDAPVCSYSLNDCGDGNTYRVTCAEANSCTCRRSNSDGTVDTTEFTVDASCVEFSTDDGKRMSEFLEANCGWNLIVP